MAEINWEQRYKDQQAALTRAQQEAAENREIVETLRGNPDYLEAIKSVEDGSWSQTTATRAASYARKPESEEPEYVKAMRDEIAALKERVEGVQEMTETEQIAAARRELDRAEAEYRKAHPDIPDDVYGKINQRIYESEGTLTFDQAARIEAFDYLKGTAPPAAPAAPPEPAPTTFAPVGGQPPPTGQSPTPTTAEEVARQAETRFKAKLGIS